MIVEKKFLENLIEKSVLDEVENILKGKWLAQNDEKILSYQFRIIPFSSLGRENGVLLGFKPDYIKIKMEEELLKKEGYVGIYQGKLSDNEEYHAIVGI